MARFLGLQWQTFLVGHTIIYLSTRLKRSVKLQPDDYEIIAFDRNVVKRHARINLKPKGESMLSQDEFIKRWQERVGKHVNATVDFKIDTLIIHLVQEVALVFNKCLLDSIHYKETIFGSGTIWANRSYKTDKKGIQPQDDDWIVDIYKDELKSSTAVHTVHYNYELYPRQFTIAKLLATLSDQLTQFMKQSDSDESKRFTLSDYFVKLELPQRVILTLTPNLVSMLGFDQTTFKERLHLGSILPATLDKREQQIFIYLDIADMMSFGSEKRPMIQHFARDKDASHVTE